ncbi:pyrimidine reductase family protein [Natronosporangium hydrolyticum]|uniref:Pyrimidine reductase family protein n=1 Tax=Natronosporangium hydrolyticum TaxID=2811111 RepID=A0A895YKE6_9ACTN|nr:pyrimidine reductase family protein [Natronosporangium hydrolyticum]QSB16465.1 pyrimidine reductase family protein [Natronosporangium hydrolyticum]
MTTHPTSGARIITGGEQLSPDELADLYAPVDPAAPMLRANMVSSLDGAVTIEGRSRGLSSPTDQRLLGLLRMRCDALLVGAGTVRVEGYGPMRMSAERRQWRRGHGLPDDPLLVVVSGGLALDPTHPLFTEAPRRPVVLTHEGAPPQRRAALAEVADVLTVGDTTVDLAAGVATLHDRGLRQLLSEGGPQLLGSLTAADLVDELCLTLSPLLAGPGAGRITAGAASPVRDMTLHQLITAGDALLLRYLRSSGS